MAHYKVFQFYHELPPWAKGVVIIGGGVVGWFGIINPVRRLIIKKLDESKSLKESKAAEDQLKSLAKSGIKPTITSAQAQSFSNSLIQAFNGCGTDEVAVYRVMSQLKNDADVYLLISTYGVRSYDGCGPFNMFSSSKDITLSAAISDELDSMEKGLVNSILTKNGVKFQFT